MIDFLGYVVDGLVYITIIFWHAFVEGAIFRADLLDGFGELHDCDVVSKVTGVDRM